MPRDFCETPKATTRSVSVVEGPATEPQMKFVLENVRVGFVVHV